MKNGKVWTWIYEHPKTFLFIMALFIALLSLTMGLTFEFIAPPRPSTEATMLAIEATTRSSQATLQAVVTQVSK